MSKENETGCGCAKNSQTKIVNNYNEKQNELLARIQLRQEKIKSSTKKNIRFF